MTEEGFRHKLAAKLSVDLESYCHLRGENEKTTIRTLTA